MDHRVEKNETKITEKEKEEANNKNNKRQTIRWKKQTEHTDMVEKDE